MPKRPSFASYWPHKRGLFHDKARRSVLATWIVWVLSIAAAVLLVSVLRHPAV